MNQTEGKRRRDLLDYVPIIISVIALITSIFTSIFAARGARTATVASNRAWIEPSEPTIVSGLNPGERLIYRFKYANIGKEPALNAVVQALPRTVDPLPPNALWYLRFPGRNEMCAEAKPNENGLVIYPSTTKKEIEYTHSTPPPDANLVLKGEKVLVIEGCIGYETFGKPHYSAFCFFVPPIGGKPPAEWSAQVCIAHNHAT
jgi:hypothetical protein